MEENIPQQQPNKSTRTFEEWKLSLKKIIASKHGITLDQVEERFFFNEPQVKSYYDQALMPTVAFNELFNH
jgi:hypothetical protein